MSSKQDILDSKYVIPALAAISGAIVGIISYKMVWESEPRLQRRLHKKKTKRIRNNPVRVWMDGCFDLMHLGHANAFRQAKQVGDIVIVGINPDDDIIKYKGGPPILSQAERAAAARACKWVDQVVEGCPYEMNAEYLDKVVFNKYKVDYIVHGDDVCLTPDGKDVYAEAKRRKKYKTIKRTEGVSTTDILGRMLLKTSDHHCHVLRGDGSVVSDPAMSTTEEFANRQHSRSSAFLASTTRLMAFFNQDKRPKPGDTVVYVDGDWDMFNVSHSALLERCRRRGDYLIVGVHSDSVVNSKKGSNFPILNMYERVFSVLSCRFVDDVIIGAPPQLTKDLLVTLNVKVVCVAHDEVAELKGDMDNDRFKVARELKLVQEVAYERTVTVEKIIERVGLEHERLQKKIKKKQVSDQAYYNSKAFVHEL